MNLQEIIQELNLIELTYPNNNTKQAPRHGYASDMLSCVMSGAKPNCIWITLQSHLNIVAVATLLELPAVIITEGNIPEPAVIEKANQENITLLSTEHSTFHVSGKLWEMGIRS